MEPPRRIGLIANLDKPEACAVARDAVRLVAGLSLEPLVEEQLAARLGESGRPEPEVLNESDLIVVLGGDGTLLSVARAYCRRPVPLLGVKIGNFGFLASASVPELPEVLQHIANGDYSTSRRRALACQVRDKSDRLVAETAAVNDVYIARFSARRLLHVRMTVNGSSTIEFRTDGIIVSTPSGSTGHSLSAGGPIVVPDVDATIVTQVCPHTLAARPLVLRADDRLRFEVTGQGEETVVATVDGQLNLEVPPEGSVELCGDKYWFILVKSPRRTYFDVLRNKFYLGGLQKP
ncbi:NAD(+)/NADH kinase [bacterium]|nr:NAD(+)/NADH kinase [bacterium]